MTASKRALLRVREEMTERKVTQRDLADTFKCSQGRIAKLLNGGVNLRVDDLDALAKAVGISLTEAVRDRGMEFSAEMTPSELRILERLRRRPGLLQATMTLLDLAEPTKSTGSVQKHVKRGRPLNSELNKRTP